MISWIVAFVVFLGLAWAFARTRRTAPASAPIPPIPNAKKSATPERTTSASFPDNSTISARSAKGRASSHRKAVPRVVDEGDGAEMTLVTASPASILPPGALPKIPHDDDDDNPDEPKSNASTIAMIYEDEAEGDEVTSPIARILVYAEGESDQGRARRRNEDSLLVFPERSLFAVADGMGGYAGGNVASALAVETLKSSFEKEIFDGKIECGTQVPRRGREMACAIQMANHAILAAAQNDPKLAKMGTTVVAARFSPGKQRVYIGHVGDSRCYRLRGTTLRQLTTDHTMAHLGLTGPGAGDLFQAVGIRPQIIIDIVVDKPRNDDLYLLCSDGLSKMASDDRIRDILLAEPDLESAVYSLIELANDNGGKDNVTVILLRILEQPAPELS